MICPTANYGTTACKWDVVIPFNKYVQIREKVIYEQEYVFDKMKSGVSYKEALEDFLSISKDGLWDNYKRIVKDKGAIVLFGNQPFTTSLIASNISGFKYCWQWDKKIPAGMSYARFRPMQQTEDIVVFTNDGGISNYYPQMIKRDKPIKSGGTKKSESAPIAHKDPNFKKTYEEKQPITLIQFDKIRRGSLHPTQKPVTLLEYLIKTYTNEGETVLDNCMGSGSTGVACINTKRNFIGIEKDDKYFEIAKKRIEEAIHGLSQN